MKNFTARWLLEWFALFAIIAGVLWFVSTLLGARHQTQPFHKTSEQITVTL